MAGGRFFAGGWVSSTLCEGAGPVAGAAEKNLDGLSSKASGGKKKDD